MQAYNPHHSPSGHQKKVTNGAESQEDLSVDHREARKKRRRSRGSRDVLFHGEEGRNINMDGSKHKLIGFTTDDFKIKRMVSSTSDLPLNKYTSLGAIFQNKNIAKSLSQYSYPVIKTPKDTLERHHILGPLPPGKPEVDPTTGLEMDDPLAALNVGMMGPKQFPEGERPEAIRLGMPPIGEDLWDPTKTPHDGIVWPLAWAPRPPYTTPGYSRRGAKQPVGVIQVERVPVVATRGNTETSREDLPTWVSPLYRSYGIGGPFGPFGPFYEPPSIDNLADHTHVKVEPPPPPKKCLLMRLWDGFKRKQIVTKDKSLGMFLNLLDEKLMTIRSLLRTDNKDDRKVVAALVQSLTAVLEDAREFENRLDPNEERLSFESDGNEGGAAEYEKVNHLRNKKGKDSPYPKGKDSPYPKEKDGGHVSHEHDHDDLT